MIRVFLRQEYPKGKVVDKCRPSAETKSVPRIQVTSQIYQDIRIVGRGTGGAVSNSVDGVLG